jgi:hypothetical protein
MEKPTLVESLSELKDLDREVDNVKQQFTTHITSKKTKPNNFEGSDGDRMVVKEQDEHYLYIKVENRWMKTKLEEI